MDPFTTAHQAIFTALQNYAPLTALVLPGNFIDTTDPLFEQFKPQITSADAPQIRILQDDFTLPPFGGNSKTVEFSQDFIVQVTTDLLRITPLNQLKYLLLIALVKAGPELGLDFVSGFTLSDCRDSFTQPADLIQKSRRWTAAMTIRVQMFLSRQTLASS